MNNHLWLSPESRAVLDAARALYSEFYANITHTPWMDWKIETWDVGYYQVRNAMKAMGGSRSVATVMGADATGRVPPAEALRASHDALRAKLLPQVYTLGFLNPDVEQIRLIGEVCRKLYAGTLAILSVVSAAVCANIWYNAHMSNAECVRLQTTGIML